jgi:transposase
MLTTVPLLNVISIIFFEPLLTCGQDSIKAPAPNEEDRRFLCRELKIDETMPKLARELFALQAREFAQLGREIEIVEVKLMAWHRADECSQRLAQIPGVGPIGASLLMMKTPDPHSFKSGRDFAAWMGLTPKDHSTAGKTRLGKITRAGDELLRSTLVVGATAVIRHAQRSQRRNASPWLLKLLERKAPKLAAVALANKAARVAWKLMVSGEHYRRPVEQPMPALAA